MKRLVGALIFPGFELLDLYGPFEMLGMLEREFKLALISAHSREIASNQGPVAVTDHLIGDGVHYDILLIPGGLGTRIEVNNLQLINWLSEAGARAEIVATVCTGAALVAKTGLLDGRRATTNKLAFDWVTAQRPAVLWQHKARWVEDGPFVTPRAFRPESTCRLL